MFSPTNTKYQIHNFLRSLAFLLFLQLVPLRQPIIAQNSTGLENLPDEISFCLADLKFDGSMIKICEFGACSVSGLRCSIKKLAWPLFFTRLKEFGLPIWFVNPFKFQKESIENSSKANVKFVKKLSDIERDPVFQNANQAYLNKKGIKNHTSIIIIRNHMMKHKEELANFKERHPGILIVGDVSDKFTRNKDLTNSLFDTPDTIDYKPRCKTYPKQYTTEIAQNIIDDLGCEMFVIKPLNSAHGNGIVIVDKKELDETLKLIFSKKKISKLIKKPLSYWKKDPEKSFIVEECAISKPITFKGKQYDPTMRIVFYIIHDTGSMEINALGAFWKLPLKSLQEDGSLTEKHKSRTDYKKEILYAEVCQEDFKIIKNLIEKMTPKLYTKMLQRHYDYFNIIENGKIIPSQQT